MVFPSLLDGAPLARLREHVATTLANESALDRSAITRESGRAGRRTRTVRAAQIGPMREVLDMLSAKLGPFLEGALQDSRIQVIDSCLMARTVPRRMSRATHCVPSCAWQARMPISHPRVR